MFKQARIRLTAWYLAIIMLISVMFSMVIYRSMTFEIDRLAERQRARWERQVFPFLEPVIDQELISELKRRILLNLGVINVVILVGSGAVGYYLAGKTLEPIAENMEAQAQFITDASHELKTPITAMRTGLEVNLREKSLDETQTRKLLTDNLNEVIRLQRLAEGLLELSSSRPVKLIPSSIGSVIEKALVEVKALAEKKKITIVEGKLTKRVALIEQEDLKRAIVILLDNSIKYSHAKGEVSIRMTNLKTQTKIEIEDKGVGIAPEDLPRVMDRFYRAEKDRSTNGYGLGLAIAKRIVEQNKGTITINSRVGKGTIVTIALPFSARIQDKT